jgi:hypothetical protein
MFMQMLFYGRYILDKTYDLAAQKINHSRYKTNCNKNGDKNRKDFTDMF